MTNPAAVNGVGDTKILHRPAPLLCLDDTFITVIAVVVKTTTTMAGSHRPRCQMSQPPSSTSLSSSSVSSTDADRGEKDGRRDCPAAAGGRSARITGWAARHMALLGCHCAFPPRWRRWLLALEDQLVLRHGFVPANRPALVPMTATKTTTASGSKSEQQDVPAAGGRQLATQLLTIAGRWAMTKREVDKSKRQLTIAH